MYVDDNCESVKNTRGLPTKGGTNTIEQLVCSELTHRVSVMDGVL
jgi:hypothetical protein